MSRTVRFAGSHVSGEVQSLAGMAGPILFDLGGERLVSPLAVAPWSDDPPEELARVEPLLQRLRGEWPCVPFGVPQTRTDLPSDWQPPAVATPWHTQAHGFSSHHDWQFDSTSEGRVDLSIAYPADHPIARLERSVSARPGQPAVDFRLTIHPRRDVELPIGLHPVFRLPDEPGAARLVLPAQARAWTFPVDVEPGRSALAPDQRDQPPAALNRDITRLPFAQPSEDLVLLTGTGGRVALENHVEGYRAILTWDAEALPSCLLWMSNGGRQFYPWNGRFRAIGIEPISGPFDLGLAHALNRNSPLARKGIRTSTALKANMPRTTSYAITCEPLS